MIGVQARYQDHSYLPQNGVLPHCPVSNKNRPLGEVLPFPRASRQTPSPLRRLLSLPEGIHVTFLQGILSSAYTLVSAYWNNQQNLNMDYKLGNGIYH